MPPNKRMFAGLYLVQGIPLGLAFQAYPSLLRDSGVALESIALIQLAGLPWVFKFLWASMVDNHWSQAIGRRKSWIIPMQVLLAICLFLLAFIEFKPAHMGLLILLSFCASFFSATQDIATDALAAEHLPKQSLGRVNHLQVAAMVLGMLIGGPLALIGIELIGQTAFILLLAILVMLCLLPVLLWSEPTTPNPSRQKASLKSFFKREKVLLYLFLGTACTTGGAIVFTLAKLILVDAGWSLVEVGQIGLVESLMIIVGCLLFNVLFSKPDRRYLSLIQLLSLGLVCVFLSGLVWAFMLSGQPLMSQAAVDGVPNAEVIPVIPVLVWASIGLAGLGIGLVSVACYTILMRYVQLGTQAGTDYAGFQSGQVMGELLMSALATTLAAQFGYAFSLLLPLLLILIAFRLLWQGRGLIQQNFASENAKTAQPHRA